MRQLEPPPSDPLLDTDDADQRLRLLRRSPMLLELPDRECPRLCDGGCRPLFEEAGDKAPWSCGSLNESITSVDGRESVETLEGGRMSGGKGLKVD